MSTAVATRAGSGSRWRRMLPPMLAVGGIAAATVALHLRDPHEQGTWGICPTNALFGIECPGCGGLRAVNDLTNLQVLDAASSNLLFVASLPVIVYVFGRWAWGRWRGGRGTRPTAPCPGRPSPSWPSWWFHLVRNTPAGSWLAP